ncbi:hypothetical protein DFW101_1339 [Solidesulfovibrio carbinoliphilus subsp. oakridgensis]|uniref:Outer membrane lipoprotein carrier protein LolA n=1 Tax=Solidesulfovibrio carbinoliphilus subsp. oakridgensis TaxID=694327 RepID=G7Q7N9_9BACT|nr:hypothetical protein [Solidesulfovibrio carbinoliphilus]EHJ47348.1 hypothetical protein DFW101_1339 [Solidesulfovibrio carbinoliphilus subsp. oakridgensis]
MSRISCGALLALLCALAAGMSTAWPAQAASRATDDSTAALSRFFQSKTRELPGQPIDFQVMAGYAMLRTGDPESSGRYAMTSINVSRVAPEIYRLDVSLEKPLARDTWSTDQPYFFTESRTYFFWYQNGEQIIFKVGGKKVALPLGRKDVLRVDIHSPDTYSIDRETMFKNISFDDGPVTIHLQLKFK